MSDCAVFFVPGIMGSRLRFLDSAGSDGGTWDPDETSGMTFWLLTSVKNIRKVFGSYTGHPIGPAPFTAIDWDPRPFGWSTVVKSYYQGFLSYLEGELGTVYAVGYDWTKDCRQSADHVAKTIEAIALLNGYKRVSIITHSMGGLVIRSALLRRPPFLKLVNGVIHIAQPVTGASIAYRRCLTGATGTAWGFDKILGNEWWKYLAQISVMPSVLELLPTNDYKPSGALSWPVSLSAIVPAPSSPHWLYDIFVPTLGAAALRTLDPDIYKVYEGSTFPGICYSYQTGPDGEFSKVEWDDVIKDLKANLALARTFHEELHPSTGLFEHPTTAYVAGGASKSTELGIIGLTRAPPAAVPFEKTIIEGVGDGTVPIDSAQALFAQEDDGSGKGVHDTAPDSASSTGRPASRLALAPGEHAAICLDKTVQKFVKDYAKYLLGKCSATAAAGSKLYIRDAVGDTGDGWMGPLATSPDIIVRRSSVTDPAASFGEGSGTKDSEKLSERPEVLEKNYIYLRALNKGGTSAKDVIASVYVSPPATLITPSIWFPVALSKPVFSEVPIGNTLSVSDPITWTPPIKGNFCVVAMMADAESVLPPVEVFTNMEAFAYFIRNNRRVAWRNLSVVAKGAPTDGGSFTPPGYIEFPFFAVGAADRDRFMALEVIPSLPPQTVVLLEFPCWMKTHVNIPVVDIVPNRDVMVGQLSPSQSSVLGGLFFRQDVQIPLRLLIHLPDNSGKDDYRIAVRQLHNNAEVGRVTWIVEDRSPNELARYSEHGRSA